MVMPRGPDALASTRVRPSGAPMVAFRAAARGWSIGQDATASTSLPRVRPASPRAWA